MLLAADFSLICKLPSASVLIGQEAVITNPAFTSPVASASHAPLALCVNMTVITPFGLMTRRHSVKIAAMRSW